jgi:hypothetical protein
VLIQGALRSRWRQAAGDGRLAACAPQSWVTFRVPWFAKLARLSPLIAPQASGPDSEPLLIKSSGSFSNRGTSGALHAAAMKQEIFREIEAVQPEFVLDLHDRRSWSLRLSPEEQRIHEWLDQFLKSENYRRVAVAENAAGRIVYCWELETAGNSPASEVYICVYWRKP